ncbi:unnamed protein product, partial [Musa acuminata subsp. malaccensis]
SDRRTPPIWNQFKEKKRRRKGPNLCRNWSRGQRRTASGAGDGVVPELVEKAH